MDILLVGFISYYLLDSKNKQTGGTTYNKLITIAQLIAGEKFDENDYEEFKQDGEKEIVDAIEYELDYLYENLEKDNIDTLKNIIYIGNELKVDKLLELLEFAKSGKYINYEKLNSFLGGTLANITVAQDMPANATVAPQVQNIPEIVALKKTLSRYETTLASELLTVLNKFSDKVVQKFLDDYFDSNWESDVGVEEVATVLIDEYNPSELEVEMETLEQQIKPLMPIQKKFLSIVEDCTNNDKWPRMNKLGTGSFGSVYKTCYAGECKYALKIQNDNQMFKNEVRALQDLQSIKGIPKLYAAWTCEDMGYLVIDNLDECNLFAGLFPTKSENKKIYNFITKIFNEMKKLDYLYIDIHDNNIMCNTNEMVLVDFGYSVKKGDDYNNCPATKLLDKTNITFNDYEKLQLANLNEQYTGGVE